MNRLGRAYLASLVCLVGGVVQIIYGFLALRFPFYDPNSYYGWDEVLWAVVNIGMIGGALGVCALNVARPRWLAFVGTAISVLSNLLRIVASVFLIVDPAHADTYFPLVLLSILLMILGMGALGIATVLGKQLRGWQSWTPLLAGGCALVIAPTYAINLPVHFFLLGMWGIAWLLLGYVVFTQAMNRRQTLGSPKSASGLT